MKEEKFLDQVISRLEPQLSDYVDVRHPQTTSNLLQVIDKNKERFLNRRIRGSSQEFRDANQSASNQFPNRKRQENWRETRVNNQYSDNSRPQREFNRFEGQGVGDNWRFDSRLRDFDKKSLIIPDDQIKQLPKVEKPVEIDLSNTKVGEGQNQKLKDLFNSFKRLFSDKPGLTHVLYNEIDTGDQRPVVSRRLYLYDRVKQRIMDYHIEKMLQEDTIRSIQSPYASLVVLTRKNNGLPPDSPEAYRFAIDYRKLNAITKYPRYPLPVIDDLIKNIPHTDIMSILDQKLSYFQLAISPKDIEKTAFINTKWHFCNPNPQNAIRPFRGGAKFSKSY
ncbi:retrovirus-related Pol polyprotein from transposon 17.6 [Trichonephila clavipes]|nr:retrovirus-related Pol polyprotein from transposon 17.6 [Trichonephila clavipes]